MRPHSLGARLVAAVLLVGGCLTGCGSDEDEYCSALKDRQTIFADDGSGVGLLDRVEDLEELADQAPDDLTDEWQTALAALDGLRDALDEAGVKPSEYVGGQPPASLSQADRDRIATAASQLSEATVVDAFSGIDQQAKDVCKLQLGL